MQIHNITRPWCVKKSKLRVGRWNSSWRWNYATHWYKWQKSRSWYSRHSGFEWWQTPLIKRLPKHKWFKRYYKFQVPVVLLSLSFIENHNAIVPDETLTLDKCINLWISKNWEKVKILNTWNIMKVITVWTDIQVSKTAKKAIENAWWKVL